MSIAYQRGNAAAMRVGSATPGEPEGCRTPKNAESRVEATQIIELISGYGWVEGRTKHLGMLQAMVDESGQTGHFLLAGLVAPAESWLAFSDEWKAVLSDGRPIPFFKMNDFLTGRGVFDGFGEAERLSKFERLAAVLRQAKASAYVVVVDEHEYRAVLADKVSITLDSPRFVVSEYLVRMVLRDLWKRRIKNTVDFVYDEGSRGYFREIEDQWREMKRVAALPLAHQIRMGNTPIERDDKKFMPLQAADMLAGQINKYYVQHILGNGPILESKHPLNISFKATGLRKGEIQKRLGMFMKAYPEGIDYEGGKARSMRRKGFINPA